MLLFWKNGYADTSIQSLEKVMKLKRTSIYNAFGNKRSLYQQALMRYLEIELEGLITALENGASAKQSIKNALIEVIKLHFNPDHPGGCMVVLSLLENNQHDEATNKMLDNAIRTLRDAIASRLKQGAEEEEFIQPMQYQNTANQIVALITGIIVMAKASFPKDELQKLIDPIIRSIFDC